MSSITLSALLSAAVLATLVASAPTVPTPTVIATVWRETDRFMSFDEEGKISVGFLPSRLTFQYLNNDVNNQLIRIEAVKAGEPCFVTYSADEQFAVGLPENDNDIFELVKANEIGGIPIYAIRAVNVRKLGVTEVVEDDTEGSASGSGAAEEDEAATAETVTEPVEECYMGFRNAASEPECFPSEDYAATRFTIIPL